MVLLMASLVYAAVNPSAFPYLSPIPPITVDSLSSGNALLKGIKPRRRKRGTMRWYFGFRIVDSF